jgi:hypothetical protein
MHNKVLGKASWDSSVYRFSSDMPGRMPCRLFLAVANEKRVYITLCWEARERERERALHTWYARPKMEKRRSRAGWFQGEFEIFSRRGLFGLMNHVEWIGAFCLLLIWDHPSRLRDLLLLAFCEMFIDWLCQKDKNLCSTHWSAAQIVKL